MHTIITLRRTRALFILIAALAAAPALSANAASNDGEANTGYFGTVAIQGYDPVAYFTDGKPVKGDPAITHTWLGAEWRFASEEHRAKFAADPVAYAPQYGGLCADGVAYDTTVVSIQPEHFRIIDGKLYMSYNADALVEFEDTKGFIAKADVNWQRVRKVLSAQ